MQDQSILLSVCAGLVSIAIGLVIYIWQTFMKKLNKIDNSVVGFIISSNKNAEDIIRANKDIETLYKKDTKRQDEVQDLEKDVHLIKHQLKISA